MCDAPIGTPHIRMYRNPYVGIIQIRFPEAVSPRRVEAHCFLSALCELPLQLFNCLQFTIFCGFVNRKIRAPMHRSENGGGFRLQTCGHVVYCLQID